MSKTLRAWLFAAALFLPGLSAGAVKEITGEEARVLYEALIKAGMPSDGFAGGTGVEARSVSCRKSRHAESGAPYYCMIEGPAEAAAPAPSEGESAASVEPLFAGIEQAETALAKGDLSEARRALLSLEGHLRKFRAQNGGQGGDFGERYDSLKAQLECEQAPPALKGAEGATEQASREAVAAAIAAKDVERLSRFVDCAPEWLRPESEPERVAPARTFAQRLLETSGKGPELRFRRNARGKWKLHQAIDTQGGNP